MTKLTDVERLTLYNQYEILKKLQSDRAEDYEKYQNVLLYGIEDSYHLFLGSFDEPASAEIYKEVFDTLSLFWLIGHVAEDHSLEKGTYPTFGGYDGNNEGTHLFLAGHITNDLGKFADVRVFNSHCPMCDRYQQLLDLHRELTGEEEPIRKLTPNIVQQLNKAYKLARI